MSAASSLFVLFSSTTKGKDTVRRRKLCNSDKKKMKDIEIDEHGVFHVPNQERETNSYEDDDRRIRTGNLWTASAHVITAVIGAGVVSLPWSVAQLGWILGSAALLFFAWVTYYMAVLQTECYRSPDPDSGNRNYRYRDAVHNILGGNKHLLCMVAQYSHLYGVLVGYTLTAAISMMALKKASCFHYKGHQANCKESGNLYLLIFGAIQLLLSQLPSLENISCMSIAAAIMSFAYSMIGLGLSIAKAAGGNNVVSSMMGVPVSPSVSSTMKIWYSLQALGNIALSYSFSVVLIEIQDTLKSPPAEKVTMSKAAKIGMSCTTLFYTSVGLVGYAAFGNDAPGNMLTGFGFYEPFWLLDIGNLCIIIHIVCAYQVFSQPLFEVVETSISNRWQIAGFLIKAKTVRTPFGSTEVSAFRLAVRSCMVASATLVAMLLPFFNVIMGLLGALSFWPLTVYFPIEMFIVQAKVARWSKTWIFLQFLSGFCLLVTVAAAVGSVAGIVRSLQHVTLFNMTS